MSGSSALTLEELGDLLEQIDRAESHGVVLTATAVTAVDKLKLQLARSKSLREQAEAHGRTNPAPQDMVLDDPHEMGEQGRSRIMNYREHQLDEAAQYRLSCIYIAVIRALMNDGIITVAMVDQFGSALFAGLKTAYLTAKHG